MKRFAQDNYGDIREDENGPWVLVGDMTEAISLVKEIRLIDDTYLNAGLAMDKIHQLLLSSDVGRPKLGD